LFKKLQNIKVNITTVSLCIDIVFNPAPSGDISF